MSIEGRTCGEHWSGGKMKNRTQIGTILTIPGGRYSLKIRRRRASLESSIRYQRIYGWLTEYHTLSCVLQDHPLEARAFPPAQEMPLQRMLSIWQDSAKPSHEEVEEGGKDPQYCKHFDKTGSQRQVVLLHTKHVYKRIRRIWRGRWCFSGWRLFSWHSDEWRSRNKSISSI